MSTHDPSDWLTTPLGAYLAERELAYFDEAVADVFGFNALQLGMPELDLLRACRIPYRFRACPRGDVRLRSDPHHLPLAGQSIDLVVLPHVLEFDAHPHQILREVERVLMPEGRLILSAFNPWSLWGVRRVWRATQDDYPWRGNYINLVRMKDWLALLGFEVVGGRMACYVPPCETEKWLLRCDFMEAAGDRWWPVLGGVYFLEAVKRVHGMRVIMPRWRDAPATKKSLATAAQREGEHTHA